MEALLASVWPFGLLAGWVGVSGWASAHAILSKRDARAAISWTGLIWLVPYFGAMLYLLLGINRVQRRAHRLRAGTTRYRAGAPPEATATKRLLAADLPSHAVQLATFVKSVTTRPLLDGNRVVALENGDEAYPVMLEAIESAEHSVWLMSYIFDDSAVGKQFVKALARAHQRGLHVRVLIDDAGAMDSDADRLLEDEGVPVERFLPARLSRRLAHFNLRNHRKVLVVDGRLGFTGGMNIHMGHLLAQRPPWPVRDVHFRVEGPVVAHLKEVFAEDWEFTTGEAILTELEWPVLERVGPIAARGVADGPDELGGGVRLALLGALACAQSSVKIVTPYFLPDQPVIVALCVAGLRGVQIDLVLPEQSDVRLVDFATRAQLWQMMSPGIRVWCARPPFDHSKFMVVDQYWSFIGSANWDARSLRLNFEFNLECYDKQLAATLTRLAAQRMAQSREILLEELDARPLPTRLRDGICRLMAPYL
ncbi:MAG: phospholipase D-like domain-containing protein [Deltaproteobacteria bacterium]